MNPTKPCLTEENITVFQRKLHEWYERHHRVLPWREVKDPYLIWISEVILQQTRVEQALSYYRNFVEHFPTVEHLAAADENSVLKCWQGLGYYSRARNLHASAKVIVEKFHGHFPKSYDEVKSLKGIGDYTAAAICSFAYDLPYAVLDGNVYRFLSRYFAMETPIDTMHGKKQFMETADMLLDRKKAALHNQAMMEMGAIQCTILSPDCNSCPLRHNCMAFKYDMVELLPIKSKKTKVRNRYFYYFFIKYQNGFFLRKREKADVWRNLYEFPLLEYENKLPIEEVLAQEESVKYFLNAGVIKQISEEKKHVLSHQHIYSRCVYVEIQEKNEYLTKHYDYVKIEESDKYPVSRLVEIFLNEYLEI